MSTPAPHAAIDPALGVRVDRAFGHALALHAAGLSLLLFLVFNDDRSAGVLRYCALVTLAAAGLGLVAGPVIARSGSFGGAFGRAFGLSVVGGALVMLVASPLVSVRSRSFGEIAWGEVQQGILFGFFASSSFAPVAVLYHRIQKARALDFAPRLYAVAATSLLAPCFAIAQTRLSPRVVPTVIVGALALGLALFANARRALWLRRVNDGLLAGLTIKERSESDDERGDEGDDTVDPPLFVSAPGGAPEHVIVRADKGAHPFRDPMKSAVIACVVPGAGSSTNAMFRDAVLGFFVGLVPVIMIGGPVWLFSQPHGR